MTDADVALQRSQVYGFLAEAFLYPSDNWLADLPLVEAALGHLSHGRPDGGSAGCLAPWQISPAMSALSLADLQADHRHTFGLTGSLCYETEIGLPHEFRQSQELADIAGFYRAFGLAIGGPVRERPDHIAVELEFMHVVTLKQACALEAGSSEHAEICADAERKFLHDHLGHWAGTFAQALARWADGSPYAEAARWMAEFVADDAARLGIQLKPSRVTDQRPTPEPTDLTCAGCAARVMLD